MYINHNQMATNVANTLTSHYGNLSTSTQRLSSGLRVNSAADDAAGLAIRELMRSDIAALNQGVRNANDAISLIQTADGALGVIDEKLIRMKELAEQAATGTYDSTQRLMIESEYQQMASEITRIANATDFNGIKLLNGNLEGTHKGDQMDAEGALKVHFGTLNDSAEDYYYIEIGEVTAAALGVGNESKFKDVTDRAADAFEKSLKDGIAAANVDEKTKGEMLSQVTGAKAAYTAAINAAIDPKKAHEYWAPTAPNEGFMQPGKDAGWPAESNSTVMNEYMAVAKGDPVAPIRQKVADALDGFNWSVTSTGDNNAAKQDDVDLVNAKILQAKNLVKAANTGLTDAELDAIFDTDANLAAGQGAITTKPAGPVTADIPTWDGSGDTQDKLDAWAAKATNQVLAGVTANVTRTNDEAITNFWSNLSEADQEKLKYAWGTAAIYNLGNAEKDREAADYGIEATGIADAFDNAAGAGILSDALKAGYNKTKDMDFAGYTIQTQEDAQHALVALSDAIVQKDKVRAHLGALQNRLENTVTNLTVQSENLQAAESRISDVDVATEMTNFVRNQILTQSAVAMLSQANSMPQMAMQLIR